uniref:Uncharacterized protein n=1 Tax=Arundo donax TaxID=35708 RepID=A0A0A9HJJ8_ARUDO
MILPRPSPQVMSTSW